MAKPCLARRRWLFTDYILANGWVSIKDPRGLLARPGAPPRLAALGGGVMGRLACLLL